MTDSLFELAEEYKQNAKDLDEQASALKAKLPSVQSYKQQRDLRRKILIIETMRDEQLDTYHQLRNYYKK